MGCFERCRFRLTPGPSKIAGSSFFGHFGMLAIRVAGLAEFAGPAVTAPRSAMLTPVENDLQVQVIPAFLGKQFFQIRFGLFDTFSIGQAPPLGQTMNVGVNWKRGHTKRLRHHNTGRLVPYTGQSFEVFKRPRDFPSMLLDQHFGQPGNCLGFLG
jgi:hypothetical protein